MNENTNQEIEAYDIGISDTVDRAKNAKATIIRLLRYLAKQKLKLSAVLITVLVSSALSLAAPLVMGKIIDQLTKGIKASLITGVKFSVGISTIGKNIILLIAIYILTSLFIYIQQYLMSGVAQTLTLGLRKELSQKLNLLPLRYYDSHKKGDILSRATSDLERVADSLQQGLMQLMQGRTSFVIAHRLSTIRDADLILVMQKGTIIEQGKHQELLNKKGFYEKLYNSQFANKAVVE